MKEVYCLCIAMLFSRTPHTIFLTTNLNFMLTKYLHLVLLFLSILTHTELYSQKLEKEWVVSSAWGYNDFSFEDSWTKLSPNRKYLASRENFNLGYIVVTDTKTGHVAAILRQPTDTIYRSPRSITWLDDNRIAAVYGGSFSDTTFPQSHIVVYDITKKVHAENIFTIQSGNYRLARIDSVTLLIDNQDFSIRNQEYDDKLYVIDVQKAMITDSIVIRHKESILHFTCDGNTIVITTTDGIVRIWDRITKQFTQQLDTKLLVFGIQSIDYNDAVGCVLINTMDSRRSVILWDLKKGTVSNYRTDFMFNPPSFNSFSINGDVFVVPGKSSYRMYETSTGNEIRSFTIDRSLIWGGIYLLEDIDEVLCFGESGRQSIDVVNTLTSKVVRTLLYPMNSIEEVQFSKAGSYVAYSCEPNIIISDMKSTLIKEVISTRGKNLFTFINDDVLAYTKDSSLVALYNVAEQKEINSFNTGDQEISSITTTKDGKKILIGTTKGRVIEYDGEKNFSQRLIVDIGQRVYYCHYDEQRQRLITVSQNPEYKYELGQLSVYNYNDGSPMTTPDTKPEITIRERALQGMTSSKNSGIPVIAVNTSGNDITIYSKGIWRWITSDTNLGNWQELTNDTANSFCYYPNNEKNLIYTSGDKHSPNSSFINILNLDTKQNIKLTEDYPFNPSLSWSGGQEMRWSCTAVSPDGKYVAAGNNYGQLACFRISGISNVKSDDNENNTSSRGLFNITNQNTITISPLVLPCKVVVSTLLGQQVLTRDITNTESLSISDLPNGFYTIALIGTNHSYYGSFIK
jgi:hypothetical protein